MIAGSAEACEELLKAGANVTSADKDGLTGECYNYFEKILILKNSYSVNNYMRTFSVEIDNFFDP